ncbi:MAG: PEMT/PEM2 family methyltransferase [Gemmatimonadales bacterium]
MWTALALAYHLASRLAYVGYVGFALKREERQAYFACRYGVEPGFRRFRRLAAVVMANDALSFILVCVVTRQSLRLGVAPFVPIIGGALLVLLGVWVKLWAAARLGAKAYYWYNFFAPDAAGAPTRSGPYRYVKNPMYTLGYLHSYGVALALGSWPGLVAAVFDQAAILAFYRWVEKPHFEKLTGADRVPPEQRVALRRRV